MEILNNNLEMKFEPYLCMLIEPETKYRFRYASEGGSHGGLAGKERKKGKKTYPTVQLQNYYGSSNDVFIRVTLCTEKKTEHVLQFKGGKKSSEYRKYIDADLDDDFCAVFKDLTILIPKKEDVYQALLNRRIKENFGRTLSKSARDKFERENREDIKKEAKEIFNSVVLKFDTFEHARPDVQICPSFYSNPICNQKDSSKGELKICRMSKVSGSCEGGEEVILLCEKVQKDNVKIKFFEMDENDNKWEAYASFNPSDVHYQVAIPFKTPQYKANMEKRVAVCLERGGETSEPRYFTYIPEDSPSKKRKKCVKEETLKQMSSPMHGSSSSSTAAVPDDFIEISEVFSWKNSTFQEIIQSPASDSNSSSQQDQDSPSTVLGSDFQKLNQLDLPFFFSKDPLGDFDFIMDNLELEEEPVNQSYSWDDEVNQKPNSIPLGQMGRTMIDAGKIEGLMAVMDLKDSESDGKISQNICETDGKICQKVYEADAKIPQKVSKKESKSKILKDKQKKLERFLPYIANKDRDGNTLLHLAVLYNKSLSKILLVIKMSNSDIINAQNNNKQTALHIAVEKNSSAVKELLLNSANPSTKTAKGDNCCHIACQHDFVKCLEYMLYPRRCHALILDDCNYEGLTPVHVALKNNSLSCLEFLFRQCYYLIDFSAKDSKLGRTFLHYAVKYSPSYVSHLLNEREIDVNCRDFNGNTPLHIACAKGNCEVVRLLMEAGADPGIRNSKHSGSNSDEGDSEDEATIGQTPADLTTDSNILNLLKYENPSDVSRSNSSENRASDEIFEELAKNLSRLLDPDMRWKELAMYVLDEEYVNSLVKCSQNPTRTILEYMKKTSGKKYIEQLIAVFDMVCFNDALKVTNEICKPSL